jgi:eukaryotic-like serine/threonine-protein kinase
MMASPTTAVPPYDYADDEMGGGPPRKGSKVWLWILGLLVVLGAVGALAYMLLSSGGKTYAVPLVQGLPVAKAEQQIAANHLRSTVVNQASSGVAKGNVISTKPAGGNNVPANTLVTLYVSSGPKKVTIPNVVGQQATTAQSTLTNDGLQVQQKPDATSTAPKGTVTKQSPGAQTTVNPGTTVTIYVSGGSVTVPSVTGDQATTAQQILQGDGFNVVTKTVAGPASATPGTVFQQTPAAQSSASQGSTVTIYVASQPTPSPSATPSPTASPTPSPTNSGGGLLGGGGGNGNGNGGGNG